MSQMRDMIKIYGLFIASIMTLVGAIFIGAGLSSGSAGIATVEVLVGGVMAFIGLGIIWSALKKPKPRPYGRYPYYPQYPGYPQYYPYQQYPGYTPYYQQPQYQQQPYRQPSQASQQTQPSYPPQQPPTLHRSYPPQSPQPYPSSYPSPRQPPYPPLPQHYRQPTRPPPPPDYKFGQAPQEEEQGPHPPEEGHELDFEDGEFPPPPDYSQITRDPHYEPAEEFRPETEEANLFPVVKEGQVQEQAQPPLGQVQEPSAPHKIMVQTSPAAAPPPPPQGYPSVYGGSGQLYPSTYSAYPYWQYQYPPSYPPGYGAPQGEAKLELPNIFTLFLIFIAAIFIGAMGLYIGGAWILLFPIAFIIAFSFPSFMWISYVYKKDVHEPEPRRVVLIALTFGFLSTILAIVLSLPFALLFPSLVVSAVIVAPLVEEFCKASGLRLVKSEINAEIDGVIYGVTIGMGFAMVENFLYELGFIFDDPAVWTFGSLLRGLGSTIGHGLGAGLIGYAYASYHMNRNRPGAINNIIYAYIAAVGLHALWNGVAVLTGENDLGLVVIVLIAVAEVVILKTLVSIARDKEIQRRMEEPPNVPVQGIGTDGSGV